MLNELFELSRSLEHYDLLRSTTHPNISNIGNVDCLLIELDSDGIPRGMRLFQKGKLPDLWKHSKGNHNSFPAIRVQKPLLSIEESKKINDIVWNKAKLTEKVALLSMLDFSSVNPECNDIKISEWSSQELKLVKENLQPELAALNKLISIFPQEEEHINFLENLLKFFCKEIKRCDQEKTLDFLKDLLVGKLDTKSRKYKAGCMTYYEVYETEKYCNLVFSVETRRALIKLLNHEDMAVIDHSHNKKVRCPLSGEETAGIGDKYPNPKIPLLGLTYLYSKKSDIPCLSRYSMTGARAFQAGKTESNKMNDAIAFLTDKSRKNKTWHAMSDSNRDKPILLITYLPDDPQNDAYLAKILGDTSDFNELDEFSEETELIYETLCEQILGKLECILQRNIQAKINLLLLETLDPGRKQIVYQTAFTVDRLSQNLRTWNIASKNHPSIEIKVWNKKKIVAYKPQCPGPGAICKLFKMNYNRSGMGKPMKQSEVSLYQIYNLYMPSILENRSPELVERFLVLAIQKSIYLLGDIGCKQTADYALSSSINSQTQARQAAMFVSFYSILLYLKGIRKENYMLDSPFNVGQFLKLADMLHKEYSIQVRNNGKKSAALPPQLMGNEMLSIVLEKPIEGLIRLGERMRIYQAWADTATGEDSGLAKWILARFEEISLKIAENELPESFNAAQQAQVLLGYMAAIPYEKSNPDKLKKEEDVSK